MEAYLIPTCLMQEQRHSFKPINQSMEQHKASKAYHVFRVSSSVPCLSVQASVEELQGAEETERRAKERAVKEAAAEAAAEKRKATQARVERMKEWDEEEIRMLEKALEKFPQVTLSQIATPFCLNGVKYQMD